MDNKNINNQKGIYANYFNDLESDKNNLQGNSAMEKNNKGVNNKSNKKTKKNIFLLVYMYFSIAVILVLLFFNISFILTGKITSKTNKVYLANNLNTQINNELVLGETYVNKFDFSYKSSNLWNKPGEVKIIIKNASIIKENGFFSNISFENFTYNEKDYIVMGKTFIDAKFGKDLKSTISFNFCPTTVGKVSIKIYVNNQFISGFEGVSNLQ